MILNGTHFTRTSDKVDVQYTRSVRVECFPFSSFERSRAYFLPAGCLQYIRWKNKETRTAMLEFTNPTEALRVVAMFSQRRFEGQLLDLTAVRGDANSASRVLLIRNLPVHVHHTEVKELFEQTGPVFSHRRLVDSHSMSSSSPSFYPPLSPT